MSGTGDSPVVAEVGTVGRRRAARWVCAAVLAVTGVLPAAVPAATAAVPPVRTKAACASAATAARSSASARATATAFVQRSGSRLVLAGCPFRFAGANEYYLGLDDNVRTAAGVPTYPRHATVDDALSSARGLGATVVRAHTLGISVGTPQSVEPRRGVWNEAAFESIDYAVASARRYGLRLMIPLTDEWRWYHGGKSTFTGWAGYRNAPDVSRNAATDWVQRWSEAHFYTDPAVIASFVEYIRHVLTHRNRYTGLRYCDDPTIAIWETGNELWDAPSAWTARIAEQIKRIAPRQLVADGSAASGKRVEEAALTSPYVDVVGGHFYPTDLAWLHRDAALAAAHRKVYVVGEYDWHGALGSWLQGLEQDRNVSGALVWTLLPHLPDGRPEPHGDGYALWSPGPDSVTSEVVRCLARHAARMT